MILNCKSLLLVLTVTPCCLCISWSSFTAIWRDRDIRRAPHLCPQKWQLLGAIRAGGPLRTFVTPNQTVVLRCHYCEDPDVEEDDEIGQGIWTFVDVVRNSAPVQLPRPIDDVEGKAPTRHRKPRIVQTEDRSLALRKPRTSDLGLYQCRQFGFRPSIESTVAFLLDMDFTLFEEQLRHEKDHPQAEDEEEIKENGGDEHDEETTSDEMIQDEETESNATFYINGTATDWLTYREQHLKSLDRIIANSSLHLQAISEWTPWSSCQHCWSTKFGIRTRRGVCVIRLPLRESDEDDVLIGELAGLPALACRSSILARLHPEVASAARRVPDFMEIDNRGCGGVCTKGNSSFSKGSWLHRLVYLFRHRRSAPLVMHTRMTVETGDTLVLVCPDATAEAPVKWEKDGEPIASFGETAPRAPRHDRNLVQRAITDMRAMENWARGKVAGGGADSREKPISDAAGVLRINNAVPRHSGNYECSVNGQTRASFHVDVIVRSTLSFNDSLRHFAYVSLVLLACLMIWGAIVLCVAVRKYFRKRLYKKYSMIPQYDVQSDSDSSAEHHPKPPPGIPTKEVEQLKKNTESQTGSQMKNHATVPSRKPSRSTAADRPGSPTSQTTYHKPSRHREQSRARPVTRRRSHLQSDIEMLRFHAPRSLSRKTKICSNDDVAPSTGRRIPNSSKSSSASIANHRTLLLSQALFPVPQWNNPNSDDLPCMPLVEAETSKKCTEAQNSSNGIPLPSTHYWSPSPISLSVLRARNSIELPKNHTLSFPAEILHSDVSIDKGLTAQNNKINPFSMSSRTSDERNRRMPVGSSPKCSLSNMEKLHINPPRRLESASLDSQQRQEGNRRSSIVQILFKHSNPNIGANSLQSQSFDQTDTGPVIFSLESKPRQCGDFEPVTPQQLSRQNSDDLFITPVKKKNCNQKSSPNLSLFYEARTLTEPASSETFMLPHSSHTEDSSKDIHCRSETIENRPTNDIQLQVNTKNKGVSFDKTEAAASLASLTFRLNPPQHRATQLTAVEKLVVQTSPQLASRVSYLPARIVPTRSEQSIKTFPKLHLPQKSEQTIQLFPTVNARKLEYSILDIPQTEADKAPEDFSLAKNFQELPSHASPSLSRPLKKYPLRSEAAGTHDLEALDKQEPLERLRLLAKLTRTAETRTPLELSAFSLCSPNRQENISTGSRSSRDINTDRALSKGRRSDGQIPYHPKEALRLVLDPLSPVTNSKSTHDLCEETASTKHDQIESEDRRNSHGFYSYHTEAMSGSKTHGVNIKCASVDNPPNVSSQSRTQTEPKQAYSTSNLHPQFHKFRPKSPDNTVAQNLLPALVSPCAIALKSQVVNELARTADPLSLKHSRSEFHPKKNPKIKIAQLEIHRADKFSSSKGTESSDHPTEMHRETFPFKDVTSDIANMLPLTSNTENRVDIKDTDRSHEPVSTKESATGSEYATVLNTNTEIPREKVGAQLYHPSSPSLGINRSLGEKNTDINCTGSRKTLDARVTTDVTTDVTTETLKSASPAVTLLGSFEDGTQSSPSRFRIQRTESEIRPYARLDQVAVAARKSAMRKLSSSLISENQESPERSKVKIRPSSTSLRKGVSKRHCPHKGFFVRQTTGNESFTIVFAKIGSTEEISTRETPCNRGITEESSQNQHSHSGAQLSRRNSSNVANSATALTGNKGMKSHSLRKFVDQMTASAVTASVVAAPSAISDQVPIPNLHSTISLYKASMKSIGNAVSSLCKKGSLSLQNIVPGHESNRVIQHAPIEDSSSRKSLKRPPSLSTIKPIPVTARPSQTRSNHRSVSTQDASTLVSPPDLPKNPTPSGQKINRITSPNYLPLPILLSSVDLQHALENTGSNRHGHENTKAQPKTSPMPVPVSLPRKESNQAFSSNEVYSSQPIILGDQILLPFTCTVKLTNSMSQATGSPSLLHYKIQQHDQSKSFIEIAPPISIPQIPSSSKYQLDSRKHSHHGHNPQSKQSKLRRDSSRSGTRIPKSPSVPKHVPIHTATRMAKTQVEHTYFPQIPLKTSHDIAVQSENFQPPYGFNTASQNETTGVTGPPPCKNFRDDSTSFNSLDRQITALKQRRVRLVGKHSQTTDSTRVTTESMLESKETKLSTEVRRPPLPPPKLRSPLPKPKLQGSSTHIRKNNNARSRQSNRTMDVKPDIHVTMTLPSATLSEAPPSMNAYSVSEHSDDTPQASRSSNIRLPISRRKSIHRLKKYSQSRSKTPVIVAAHYTGITKAETGKRLSSMKASSSRPARKVSRIRASILSPGPRSPRTKTRNPHKSPPARSTDVFTCEKDSSLTPNSLKSNYKLSPRSSKSAKVGILRKPIENDSKRHQIIHFLTQKVDDSSNAIEGSSPLPIHESKSHCTRYRFVTASREMTSFSAIEESKCQHASTGKGNGQVFPFQDDVSCERNKSRNESAGSFEGVHSNDCLPKNTSKLDDIQKTSLETILQTHQEKNARTDHFSEALAAVAQEVLAISMVKKTSRPQTPTNPLDCNHHCVSPKAPKNHNNSPGLPLEKSTFNFVQTVPRKPETFAHHYCPPLRTKSSKRCTRRRRSMIDHASRSETSFQRYRKPAATCESSDRLRYTPMSAQNDYVPGKSDLLAGGTQAESRQFITMPPANYLISQNQNTMTEKNNLVSAHFEGLDLVREPDLENTSIT